MRTWRTVVSLLLVASLTAVTVLGCEPTLQQATGVVIDIDSPALGRVDGFELLTTDGERLQFDTTELEFRSEFPAAHLAEHRVLGDHIEVTYKTEGDRRLVTQLDDAGH
jgi:hypothetical protein